MAMKSCKECGKQISTDAVMCPNCGKSFKTRSGIGVGGGCLLIIGFLIVVSIISVINNTTEHINTSDVKAPPNPKQAVLSQVKLIGYQWRKKGFDNVLEADFTIKNSSDKDTKDFEIHCVHYAQSGTEIDSNTRTIYDVVRAHSTKKFPNFDMGFIHTQAVKSACGITDLTVIQ